MRIAPDAGDFAEQLKSKVEEATAGAEGVVKIGADDEDLQAVLDDAKAKLDELDSAEGRVTLSADDEDLSEKVDDARSKVEGLDGTTAEPVVLLDSEEFDEAADAATEQLSQLDGETAAPALELETGGFDAGAEAVTEQLSQLDAERATPSAHLSDEDATARISELKARLAVLKAQRAGITITADPTPAEMQIAELEAQIAGLQNQARSVSVGGGGGEGGGFGMPGGLMGGLAAGLAALSPGFAGAATGLGLLGGTGALAFGGITQALSAAHQATNTLGMTSQQVTAQHFSNSVQITQAQQGVTQAKEQAAQNQVTSSQQIQQADMNLAMTARNTAAQQVQALQSVQQAQQQVQQATYNLGEANYNLGQAYVQARQDIINLNDQLANSKLSVQSASLAVQQAEYQERLVNQNAYSTSIDRAQASLAVAQAKQQLKDATDQEAQAQYSANLANKQGVNGSQTVIQAKQAQVSAQNGVIDATNAAKDAQVNLVNTQLNSQDQLKQAQMQAASAQEQAAYQQKMDAQAVANAELNLTDTIKGQQLQWAAMVSTQNQALNQFNFYMAKLTPAGRGFVNQLLGMRGAFRQLEAVAQNTVLPGMSKWLTGISDLLPGISRGVSLMGGAISKAFAGFGKELASPAAMRVLNGLVDNGVRFANVVLPAFARFLGDLAQVGAKKGAVDGLAGLLAGLADGLGNLVKGLSPFLGGLSSLFSGLGQALNDLGGPLGQVIGALASALAPAVQALLPGFKALVDGLGSGLAKALTGIAPVLGTVAQGVSIMAEAFAPLLPQLGAIIGQLASELQPVLIALMPSVKSLAAALAGNLGAQLTQVMDLVVQVVPQLLNLAVTFTPLVNAVMKAATWLMTWAARLSGPLADGIAWFVGRVLWFAAQWSSALHGIERLAGWLWHEVLDPMWQGLASGADWAVGKLGAAWGRLESVFKVPVNFLIQKVYDDGIARLWNDVTGAVHLSSLKLPVIAALAGGGVIPGYAPGRDTVPAMLSPGESVLTPGATRAIGAGTVHALNAAYAPSGGSRAPGHYSFGSLGSIVSGAAHDVLNAGKIGMAVLTGNTTEFVNAASQVIGTPAAGALGQVMMAMPKALVGDMAKALSSALTSTAASGSSPASGSISGWMQAAVKAAGVPASWIPDLETIAMHESSDSATAVNNYDSNAAAGNASRGIMQVVPTTFAEYHVPGTSLNIFDPVANIAAAARYIQARYGNPGDVPGIVSLAHGGNYVGYDSGGVLPPGMTMAVNKTGKPEAVLTARQSEALEAVLSRPSAAAGAPPAINVNFYGTQLPSAEQMAEIERRLSLAVSGG